LLVDNIIRLREIFGQSGIGWGIQKINHLLAANNRVSYLFFTIQLQIFALNPIDLGFQTNRSLRISTGTMAITRWSLNQVKCNDLERIFVQQNSIFPSSFLFHGFHHLAGSLSSRPLFLGIFKYFPPARVSFSSGNRGVLKTCAHRTQLNSW
jgi:hypothetical protein